MRDPKTIETGQHAIGIGGHAAKCGRNLKVFECSEIVLQGIEVADEYQIPGIFLALGADGPPTPAQFASARRNQAAHDAQQAGLAAAVGPGHAQQLAPTEPEAQFAEQPPFTPGALELTRFKHCSNTLSKCPSGE